MPPEFCPSILPQPLQTAIERVPLLEWPVRYAWRLGERWGCDACSLMAASMAFFGLLSIFPLVLAGVTILARLLAGNTNTLTEFAQFVGSFFPGAAGEGVALEIQRGVTAIATGPDAAIATLIALGSLLWSGRAYFDTLITVLNRIWPGAQQRTFVMHQVSLVGLLLGTGLLFFLSTITTFALRLAQTIAAEAAGASLFINRAPVLWDWLGKFVAWLLTVFMFYLLYRFGPNRQQEERQHRRVILGAALVAALGFEAAKWGFTRFLGNVARYEATYGGVAGVVVTMLWIYIASLIILLGAEAAATYEDVKRWQHEKSGGTAPKP